MEKFIERVLFASRWLLAPVYLCMSLVLLALGFKFFQEVYFLYQKLSAMGDADFILKLLGLVDLLLVGGLIVMVMFSGYENFVSKIDADDAPEKLGWLGQLDTGTLKLKVAASIVAISSIFLLKKFMSIEKVLADLSAQHNVPITDIPFFMNPLFWYVLIHLTFVASAVFLGVLDKLSFAAHRTHT